MGWAPSSCADDEALGREVAVKILGPDLVGSGERAERFLREVRAVARLRHPNIVSVHSAGEQDGLRYMVMELVAGLEPPGRDGRRRGAGTRGRPSRDVLRMGIEIAQRARRRPTRPGIVHRDVKPSNIRIAPDGRAVLLDFGLAREAGGGRRLTETGGVPRIAAVRVTGTGRPQGRARSTRGPTSTRSAPRSTRR